MSIRHVLSVAFLGFLMIAPAWAKESPPAKKPSLKLDACELPGYDGPARCGTYEVFEDRQSGTGRKIPLRVAVMASDPETPSREAIILFAGGPGGSAVERAPLAAVLAGPLLKDFDVLLVDLRGTGGSQPLMCGYQLEPRGREEVLETFIPTDKVAACRRKWERTVDLTTFHTPNLVDDVHEVRGALGYEAVHLMGGSYGSQSALVYLRRHPEVVKSLVISGVVPMGRKMPLTFARDAQNAFDGLLRECAAEAPCHAAFADPKGDLEALLAELRRRPKPLKIDNPMGGEDIELTMSANMLIQTVRYLLYNAGRALEVPVSLHQARQGDWTRLGIAAYFIAGGLLEGLPDGLYLSVTCSEGVRQIEEKDIEAATKGTFLGRFRIDQQRAACALWPRNTLPKGYEEPIRSSKPVLLVSGERDPVTPPAWAAEAARSLPNSRHLIVPDGGHSQFGLQGTECIQALTEQVVRRASAGDLNIEDLDVDGCAASIQRPPFPLK